MICELKMPEFYKCRDLLYENGQLEAKAVVEGINPGRIFVDDTDSPKSGLIWLGNNDGFIFIGNEKNEGFHSEIAHFIDAVIIPEARKIGLTWFEAIGNHNKWDDTIQKIFENRHLGSWNQRVYTLQQVDYRNDIELKIGEGYNIVKISEILFNNRDHAISNIEFLRSKILECWSTPESFFHNGVGYCVINKDKIVSLCFSGFVVGHVHGIDIETHREHQGKKLAQNIAFSFVEECLAKNLLPYWDCMDSNKPSIAVAEKIGFRNVFNYVGFEFKFD